jgi:hypothetical protein
MTMNVTVEQARRCSLVLQVILVWPLVARGGVAVAVAGTRRDETHRYVLGPPEQPYRCCALLLTAARDLLSRVIRSCVEVSFSIGF